MSKTPSKVGRNHLILIKEQHSSPGIVNHMHKMPQKPELCRWEKTSFIDRFLSVYNRVMYNLVLLGTLIMLGFLLFGHAGILLENCCR